MNASVFHPPGPSLKALPDFLTTSPGIVVAVIAHCLLFLLPVSLELGQNQGLPALQVNLEPERSVSSEHPEPGGREQSVAPPPPIQPSPATHQRVRTTDPASESAPADALDHMETITERESPPPADQRVPVEKRAEATSPPLSGESFPVPVEKTSPLSVDSHAADTAPSGDTHFGGDPESREGLPLETSFGLPDAPTFIHRELPSYPPLARRRGVEGTVLLRLSIDAGGQVTAIDVLEDPGHGFADAAVTAVKQSTFNPAYRNGKPRASRALLPVRFELR